MISLFLAFQAAALSAAPPADWSALPPLRLTTTPDYAALMTSFVRGEVAGGRCATGGRSAITIDLAVLVSKSGDVLRIVPRAINCPTVEQFAAGVVQKAARDNLAGATPASDSWYRTGMTLNW
jgi:hypothetical protein